jgi:hypothetical protein
VKTNLKGELASNLLAPALRTRFFELFGVASRKSVFAWQEAVLPQAQVVVLDGSSDLSGLRSWPPCVIWVGAIPSSWGNFTAWTGRLAQNYTVADLIDVLDRAAVFLLDWKARQHNLVRSVAPSSAFANPGVQPVAPTKSGPASASASAARQSTHYRLRAWVFLGAPFDSAGCVTALALLTRQPVTVQQLQQHSGQSAAMVIALLQELARRKVLQASVPAPAPHAVRSAPTVHKGFVRRLSHWLKGASRA